MEEKQKKLLETKEKSELIQNESKKVLLEKISRTEKRRQELKLKQDEENQLKYNKMYMSMEEKRARVARNEKIREFQRAQQLKQIEERMKRIEVMKVEREKISRERKLLSERISLKKKKMIAKFEVVMRHNRNISKDEIYKKILEGVDEGQNPSTTYNKKSNLKEENQDEKNKTIEN